MTFTDLGGAVAAIQAIERDYERHADGARQFARKHLDSDQVLARRVVTSSSPRAAEQSHRASL
jgi:hypothetical protein